MDIKRATQIISALADGVDPYTGEIFSNNSSFQNAETVRALVLALKGLEKLQSRELQSKNKPNKAGTPWTPEEDNDLANSYDLGISIKELAEKHGRTKGAIESRLMRIGKLQL